MRVALGDHCQAVVAAIGQLDVGEESAILVAPRLRGIGNESDFLIREEIARLARRLAAVALDGTTEVDRLRRVDPDDAHGLGPVAEADSERVAVGDADYRGGQRLAQAGKRNFSRERRRRGCWSERQPGGIRGSGRTAADRRERQQQRANQSDEPAPQSLLPPHLSGARRDGASGGEESEATMQCAASAAGGGSRPATGSIA